MFLTTYYREKYDNKEKNLNNIYEPLLKLHFGRVLLECHLLDYHSWLYLIMENF
jgi:hypothetical protein